MAKRLFSGLKFIKNDLRSSLKDDKIKDILFLRHNFQYFSPNAFFGPFF